MKNIKWDDLSIADLGMICINANEKIKQSGELKRVNKWYEAGRFERVLNDESTSSKMEWIRIRDIALSMLDKKIKSLV